MALPAGGSPGLLCASGTIPTPSPPAGDPQGERAYLDSLRTRWVDGVRFAGVGGEVGDLHELMAEGVPAVLIARDVGGGQIDTVLTDGVAGLRLGANHLLRLGHRRVA